MGPVVSIALLVSLLGMACAREPESPPNLLLVTVDTLRADRLACYGGPRDVGSGICALADSGTRFAWAFSTAPYTAPSVASLLTSRYPSRHGVIQSAGSALGSGALSLAETLRSAGYVTAAVVSNPVLDRFRNFRQGFDVYDSEMTRREGTRPAVEREAAATTDAALTWARERASAPWFLWVHYQDPHGPYEPPGAPPARDAPEASPLPVLENESGHGGIPAYQALPELHSAEAYEARYLDEIRYADRHVQRLVAELEALGAAPALLLTSDHGEAFGEDGFYFAHGHSVGLDQIRVPLLWRPPGGGKARVVQRPVSLLDVAPTLLLAAGVEIPPGFQGRPLPIGGVEAGPRERALFAEHRRYVAVIADGVYYSRDREVGRPEPLYPTRSAILRGDGALPAYAYPAAPEVPADLERRLGEFLESAPKRSAPARGEVTPETRRRMQALGYVE
jgi:arylsulfatase A-like enzyme